MTSGDERDIARLRRQVDRVERDAERRAGRTVDFGARALVISVAVFVLIVGWVLPWMAGATGYEVLLGIGPGAAGKASMVPRLFAATSLVFGVLASALTLTTRRWAFAWASALGGWFASVDGVLAIWSRQSSHADLGAGLVIAWVAMVVIAIQWFRTAWSRPDPARDEPAPDQP
jgi:hypothetical protein